METFYFISLFLRGLGLEDAIVCIEIEIRIENKYIISCMIIREWADGHDIDKPIVFLENFQLDYMAS